MALRHRADDDDEDDDEEFTALPISDRGLCSVTTIGSAVAAAAAVAAEADTDDGDIEPAHAVLAADRSTSTPSMAAHEAPAEAVRCSTWFSAACWSLTPSGSSWGSH